jgi:NAD(P)-dependent dehydrogenase (short-subunit alcohol dehydrogenase family)
VAYAKAGASVVIGDIREATAPGNFDQAPAKTTSELIAGEGGQAIFVHCDVSLATDVEALVTAAAETYGRLDIFVNNAGVYRGGGPMHTLAIDDVDACWNVLVKGSWFGCQQAVSQFLSQGGGGSIVNVVSTAGLRAHVGQAPYNMAKAAQANLTRCVALEYAPDNIRANGICPTYVKTAMSRGGFESDEMSGLVESVIPLHRWGEIGDVVNAALFFASDDSAFLTGVLLPVDGGEMLSGAARPEVKPGS